MNFDRFICVLQVLSEIYLLVGEKGKTAMRVVRMMSNVAPMFDPVLFLLALTEVRQRVQAKVFGRQIRDSAVELRNQS